jgi:hypothetical protein
MNRANRLIRASGVVLLVLAGCASLDLHSLFLLQSDNAGQDRVLEGSLDAVAESTKNTLTQLGFAANVNRQGEAVYISSKTSTGSKFTLILTRDKGKDGEKTHVRLKWEGTGDEQTGFQILSQLDIAGKH